MPDEQEMKANELPAAAPPVMPPIKQPIYRQPVPQTDATLGGLIPVNNKKALASYYLGLFSIFPLLGLFMGAFAIQLGLQGSRLAKEHPEVKGKTHAGIGVGCGLIGLLLNVLVWASLIVALLNNR